MGALRRLGAVLPPPSRGQRLRDQAWPADWRHRLEGSGTDTLLFICLLHPSLQSQGAFSEPLPCPLTSGRDVRGMEIEGTTHGMQSLSSSWGKLSGQRSAKVNKTKPQPAEDQLMRKQGLRLRVERRDRQMGGSGSASSTRCL